MAHNAKMAYFRVLLLSFLYQLSIACQDIPVGIADRNIIPDDNFTATSHYDSRYVPKNARLNGAARGWGPKTVTDPNDYLQIDLGHVFVICAVATQGGEGRDEWTTKYNISTSMDDTTWKMYQNGPTTKLFNGNVDRNTIVKNSLNPPVQARYVRFIPTAYQGWKVLRVEVYGIRSDLPCRSLPVGINNGKIPDSGMKSSSSYNSTTSPSKARLNYTAGSSWCAATSDSSPYLQINLGSPYIICGIATQGDHMTEQWVQSYQMHTSTDGSTFTKYVERGVVKNFSGGFDSDTTVQIPLYNGAVAQYVRVTPTSHYGSSNCLRIEMYGITVTEGCSSLSVGLSYSSVIPNHRFSASSYYDSRYKPDHGRLLSNKVWGPKKLSDGDWLQIDLGSVIHVCAVATQGGGVMTGETVTRYKIRVSLDSVNWKYYQKNNIDKVFAGNTERFSVVTNALTIPTRAKFLRFYPTAYIDWPSMRAEVYGIRSACSSPIGIEVGGAFQTSHMISSSHLNNTHAASRGRLYGSSSWCSNTSSNTEYIQINLGQVMTVTGIATQGDHTMDKWVETYTVSYSMDGNLWNTYKAGQDAAKVFQGNRDKESIVVRWLTHPLTARHVRVTPQTWNTSICMRMELYGCSFVTKPVISGLSNQDLTAAASSYVDLVCNVKEPLIQYIRWYTSNNTDITSKSTGLVRDVDGLKSTLRVNYTTADDVINAYHCERSVSSVVCSKSYVCRAQYKNVKLDSDAAKSAGVRILLDIPSTIATPRVDNIKSTSVRVRWTQTLLQQAQATVTSYSLQYQNITHTWTIDVRPLAVSHLITGLGIYCNYSVKIKAISRVGPGEWSRPKNFTTDSDLPIAIPDLVAVKGLTSQSLRITWQSPTAGVNGPLQGYKIIYAPVTRNNDETMTVIRGRQTSHTINSLKVWSLYRIKIKVFNDKGDGPSKIVVGRTLEDAPSQAPEQLGVAVLSSTSVQLSWRIPPKHSHNGIIRGFKVYYESSSRHSLIKNIPGNGTIQYVVDRLEKYTLYSFKLLAYTTKDGPYTQSISATTDQDAPSTPLNLQASIIAPNATTGPQVQLAWDRPAFPNGIIKSYIVSYNHSEKPSVVSKSIVQGLVMTVTIPVLGSLTYWFHVRAVTVKEGNDTSPKEIFVPIYAPSMSPSITRVTKQGPSRFVVSWQPIPRDKANGPITKYDVTWILLMRDNQPVKAISTEKEMNGSTATLDNLLTCAKYNILVRGHTKAGPGPYSTPFIFYSSAPGPPEDVMVTYKDKREVTLHWENTKPSIKIINQYTVYFLGTKRYNNTFIHRGNRVTRNPLTKLTVQHLYPDTHYEFWVSASSKCGEGQRSVGVSTDTYIDAPPSPLMRPPLGYFNTSITNVTLWPASDINGQIRAYQLIVQQLGESSIDPSRLTDHSTAKQKDLHYYITAEVDPNIGPFPRIFTIGNGNFYVGYENVKLESGKKYKVLQRALTKDNRKTFLPGPMVVIARGAIAMSDGSKDRFKSMRKTDLQISLVGCSIIGGLCLLVMLLLCYIWRIKRKNRTVKAEKRLSQKSKAEEAGSENTLEMEERKYTPENVGSVPNPPIITEDVYEQIDQRCGPEIRNQEITIQNTCAYADVEHEDNDDDDDPLHPPPPIIDEDYEEIDSSIRTRKTETDRQSVGHAVDSVKISTQFIKPRSVYYEDMTTGNSTHYVNPKQGMEVYVGEGNIKKKERPNYEALQLDVPQSKYKELHDYGNIGCNDQTDSYS